MDGYVYKRTSRCTHEQLGRSVMGNSPVALTGMPPLIHVLIMYVGSLRGIIPATHIDGIPCIEISSP